MASPQLNEMLGGLSRHLPQIRGATLSPFSPLSISLTFRHFAPAVQSVGMSNIFDLSRHFSSGRRTVHLLLPNLRAVVLRSANKTKLSYFPNSLVACLGICRGTLLVHDSNNNPLILFRRLQCNIAAPTISPPTYHKSGLDAFSLRILGFDRFVSPA